MCQNILSRREKSVKTSRQTHVVAILRCSNRLKLCEDFHPLVNNKEGEKEKSCDCSGVRLFIYTCFRNGRKKEKKLINKVKHFREKLFLHFYLKQKKIFFGEFSPRIFQFSSRSAARFSLQSSRNFHLKRFERVFSLATFFEVYK